MLSITRKLASNKSYGQPDDDCVVLMQVPARAEPCQIQVFACRSGPRVRFQIDAPRDIIVNRADWKSGKAVQA